MHLFQWQVNFQLGTRDTATASTVTTHVATEILGIPVAALLDRHAALCAALPAAHPNYRPGAWIPHVTLADDVTAGTVGAGIDLVAERFHPFTAILDRVELLRFPPITLLWHAHLAAANMHS